MSTIKINTDDASKLNEIRKTISESHEIKINVDELERNLNDNKEMEINVMDNYNNKDTTEELYTSKKLFNDFQEVIQKNINLILYVLIVIFVMFTIFCLYKVYGIKYLRYGMRPIRATVKRNRKFIKYHSK